MDAILDRNLRVARLARRQHGVVARRQLLALGITARTLDGWLRQARVLQVHRGVYAIGHARLTIKGGQLAAVLACGPTAVLSHASAAALWELVPNQPTRIHVIARTYAGNTAPRGVRLHRYRSLVDEDVTTRDAIPVTTPARTLLDLAPTLPRRKLDRALAQADQRRRLDFADVDRLLQAHPRRSGAKTLRRLLEDHRPGLTLSRSDFEDRVAELCANHGLPRPRVNATVAGLEVDLSWPGTDVIAEADGYAFHRTRAAFERDRKKDARLADAGFRVHRFTDRQVTHRPHEVVAALRRSLSDARRMPTEIRQAAR